MQDVDCEALKDVPLQMEFSGLALKVLNNALIIYKQYEPQECDLCAAELDNLLEGISAALDHAKKHIGENHDN
jgi:hypothetical protein